VVFGFKFVLNFKASLSQAKDHSKLVFCIYFLKNRGGSSFNSFKLPPPQQQQQPPPPQPPPHQQSFTPAHA
jgi:hypothetical protein